MASAEKSERQRVVEAIEKLDYIRFTHSDINGVPRGKLVPAREAPRFLDGMSCYAGLLPFGACDEIPLKTLHEFDEVGHPNYKLVPDLSTFHPIPWAGAGKYRVGELFAIHYHPKTLEPFPVSPRYVALEQLRKLNEMGYNLFSGWELEFQLYEKGTTKPIYEGLNALHPATLAKMDDVIMDMENSLHEVGVAIETIHTEYHPGQLEMATRPVVGIKAADDAFLAKSTIREVAYQKGYDANFMSKMDYVGCGSGMHFNHSLWHKETGLNAHYDEDGVDCLSDVGRYWVGGLMAHIDALCALCSPTINCYRRLHVAWAPDQASWGIDDRVTSMRVKNDGPSGSFVENRLPGTICNPYLVLAATVAAGMDGIVNKIDPPPKGVTKDSPFLPHTLQEALAALNADKTMVVSLGDKFVKWFTDMKEELEIPKFGHHNVKENIEMELAAEIDYYSKKL